MQVNKLGVIIDQTMFDNKDDGININGPCLIRVPSFIKNPLGKYYCYFAHHAGKYIRLAYSDKIEGPYKIYKNGTLHIKDTTGFNHIASPDVHIDCNKQQIIMYYHCPYNNNITPQSTLSAISSDGLNFISNNSNIIYPYFRKFTYNNFDYGLAMKKDFKKHNTTEIPYFGLSWKSAPATNQKSVTAVLKKVNNNWIEIGNILPFSRHACIMITDKIYILYTTVGDNPEHIQICELLINRNNIQTNNSKKFIEPDTEFEYDNIHSKPSVYGVTYDNVKELRDPYIFNENSNYYLLYTIGGEKGIAIAKININC